MKKEQKLGKRFVWNIIYILLTVSAMAGGALLAGAKFAKDWIVKKWGGIPVGEIIYQLKVPLETNLEAEWRELFLYAVPAAVFLAIIICVVMTALRKRRVVAVLMAAVILVSAGIWVPQYYQDVKNAVPYEEYKAMREVNPDIIESNYVDPRNVNLTFPEKKRNLIYIFVESVENTFMSKMDGGAYDVNYIPELTELAEENLNFSHTDQVGGAYEVEGIRWTVASMFAQTSGLPLLIPIARNAMTTQEVFLPKVWSLGNILEQEGYNQELLVGSDAVFGGRLQYFTQHGNYKVYDYGTARDKGKFPPDYRVWWGYEDQRLFEYAKEELTELAAKDEPFNFTMLTVDTHKENGWPCPLCRWEYGPDQYGSVLSCSSRQVAQFVAWIRQQEFYKNTTVIISGDHRTMDADFCAYIDPNYRRTIYNAFLNTPEKPDEDRTTFRKFTTMDMFPTTLASLGVEIEGDRLGLGTNLYSKKKTLAEKMGVHNLSNGLADAKENSEFWKNFTEEIVIPEE